MTREQEFAGLFFGSDQIIIDRLAGLFAQLKSDRLSGLLLSHGCTIRRVPSGGNIFDLNRDNVTAAKLAIDSPD
jgi:hypothetical protein